MAFAAHETGGPRAQLMAASGNVQVDNIDIGCSDHFLAWIELGRITNRSIKEKCCVIQ